MTCKHFLASALVLAAVSVPGTAQTNFQTFYDFGRGHFTTTLEGYYADKWGDTFFFVDYDYNQAIEHGSAVGGSYFEIERGLNFWKESALKDLSLHVEYNAGVGFQYYNFLFGVNYALHNADFSNVFTFELMYKTFNGPLLHPASPLPLQFSFVWGMQDLFGVKGLRFSGFADIWGQYVEAVKVVGEMPAIESFVFISEPQLWYNVGRHFGVENLHVGTEIELSCHFAGVYGFKVRPCLGTKWVF